jgi:hypothetical protein
MQFLGIPDPARPQQSISQPSPRFLEVAQDLAGKVGMSAEQVIEGRPLVYKALSFNLQHHGQLDPSGALILLHLAPLPEREGEFTCRQLLEFNAMMPAGGNAFYGVFPATNTIVYVVRVDLDRNPDAADVILAFVGVMADQIEQAAKVLRGDLEKMIRELEQKAAANA